MIKTGEPAPPFSLTDATGNRVSLQDMTGPGYPRPRDSQARSVNSLELRGVLCWNPSFRA